MSLLNFVEGLQGKGKLWFTKIEAQQALDCSELAIDKSIERLAKKNKVVTLKPGFIFIVPVEYKSWGVVPADWFIDPLMQHLSISYYSGLLTAASFHGAAHQKPQIFQVVSNQRVEAITKKRVQVKFYNNQALPVVPTQKIQVKTGYMQISTPEATALDLVKYYRSCGYFSNVATVLAELKDVMQVNQLLDLVQKNVYESAVLQRFGFLMSLTEVDGGEFVKELEKKIERENPRFVPLQPGTKYNSANRDTKWRLFINEEIEVDQ